jgi:hypothetical protein
MRLSILLSVIIIGATSCDSSISPDKITVIDNLVLGKSKNDFTNQIDSLGFSSTPFYTKIFFHQFSDVIDKTNTISQYYTKTFNFPEYQNPPFEHIGLFRATLAPNSENVVELNVILGHTAKPYFLGEAGLYLFDKIDKWSFSQNVNLKLLDEIEQLYTSKYGKPSQTSRDPSNSFFVIDGNHFVLRNENSSRTGFKLTWETEYMTITFFKGITSVESLYNERYKKYIDKEILFSSATESETLYPNPIENEIGCNSYPYISYRLKDQTIIALRLDQKPV